MRFAGHFLAVSLLTALTQIGGFAWLVALAFHRRLLAFVIVYCTLLVAASQLAPLAGRVPLPCFGSGPLQPQSVIFCGLVRNYVTPELAQVAKDLAAHMDESFPGTVTGYLDGNFPFFSGFPMLPHISHDDGAKLDIALYWADASGNYLPGQAKSPIGYWGYAEGPSACPATVMDLRWDMPWLQRLLPDLMLEPRRTRTALAWLAENSEVRRVFVEPHLRSNLGIAHETIRFQGCRAARHDDHIHFQL